MRPRQPIPGREPIHIGRADSIGAQSGVGSANVKRALQTANIAGRKLGGVKLKTFGADRLPLFPLLFKALP